MARKFRKKSDLVMIFLPGLGRVTHDEVIEGDQYAKYVPSLLVEVEVADQAEAPSEAPVAQDPAPKDPDATKPSLEPAILAAEERKRLVEPEVPLVVEPIALSVPDVEPEAAEEPEAPSKPDDLRSIKGVGGSMEKKLQSAGYETFKSLAEVDPEKLVSDVGMSLKVAKSIVSQATKIVEG